MQAFIPFSILGAVTLAIAGCGGGGGDDDGDGRVGVGDTVVITTDNQVRSFNRNNPDNIVGRQGIQGLASGETLVGIDYRPANRQLYALGDRGGVYTLDPATGRATQVSTLRAAAGDDNPYTALSGGQFGIDFNPVADRLRVVSDNGQNLRINVDTGDTITDGPLTQAPGIAATPAVTAAAYTNSVAGATTTTLYVADLSRGALQVQNPPNNGTLDAGITLGVTGSDFNGFDIESTGTVGYLAVQSNVGVTLYRVSLTATTGDAAQRVGLINSPDRVVGLALVQAN